VKLVHFSTTTLVSQYMTFYCLGTRRCSICCYISPHWWEGCSSKKLPVAGNAFLYRVAGNATTAVGHPLVDDLLPTAYPTGGLCTTCCLKCLMVDDEFPTVPAGTAAHPLVNGARYVVIYYMNKQKCRRKHTCSSRWWSVVTRCA
jgi:hypothetical protein